MMVVLVAAISVAFARPASADVCSDAPDPVAPKSGLPGMLTTTPKQIPDKAPNPFTETKVSIGQVYGYNWNWSNYDLGCGPDFLRDPVAVTNTQTGNVILSIVGAVLAGLASLEQMAKTSSLNWFSTVIGGIATKLRVPVLTIWLPLAMLGVGLIVAFRAKRTSYAETMRTLLIIALAATMAVFALAFPAVASRTVDRGVVSVSNAAGAQFSSSPSDAVTRGSAYRTWLTGNFGDPDSAVAKQLGPELMDATHYSWSDIKRIQTDPDTKKQIDDAKSAEFKDVAKQLKQQDPAGYEEFAGRGERTGPALMGVVVSLAMSLFVALSMIMVLIARMMMQGLALAAPLAAVVGVLPTQRSVLSRMWDLFAAAIVAVAKFVIAGGVMTMVLGAIETNTNLGAGAQLFWIVVATVVGLVLTRPLHSFKSIVPGLDPNRSYLRTALNGVTNYLGVRLGTESALDDLPQLVTATKPSEPTEGPMASPSARESLPALPSPDWDRSESTRIVQMEQPTQADSAETSPSQTERSWPGVVASRPMAQLPASPRQLEAAPVSTGVSRPTLTALPSATADLDTSRPNRGPELPGGSSGEGTTEPESPSGDRPRSDGGPAESGSEVVYPTGIIVADDEMALYRRSQLDAGDGETYIPMAEPELAEDGTEHALVTYHSHAGADDAST
ncbi:hypothetical protein GCM10011575_35860 [Microlunatus endophyticus]|uniref:TrbL/VirB6 plasmid conjugal transfer protein n=1 Tax=Microlunatus endophyticus TaxID=1716077 RepID=A0A917SEF9_9ACTN|nr:hypothetical protein GCM10011575_35860 [Microlunatus endophyticus]